MVSRKRPSAGTSRSPVSRPGRGLPLPREDRGECLQVRLRGAPGAPLQRALDQALRCAQALGLDAPRQATPPTRRRRWSVLRSPHVHKTARDAWALHTAQVLCRWEGASPQRLALLWEGLRQVEWVGVEVRATLHHGTALH